MAKKKQLYGRTYTTFNSSKILTVTDTGIQKILLNHLKQFDTVELSFEEAITYFNSLLEKQEFEAIVKDGENEFNSVDDFIFHLRGKKYKFNKVNYSILNVFIEKVSEQNFRNEKGVDGKNKYEIDEHPEIAFTPEEIEEMNKSENIRKLNTNDKGEEKNHTPIKKVRISRGFGNQRALNKENNLSVKSKQYVVNDAGSNLYLGFYERTYIDSAGNEVPERKLQAIGLMDLIETLKQDKSKRLNPLSDKIYDDKQNEYNLIFTLSPLDLVYVPTEEEIENLSLVQFDRLSGEQVQRIYKYVDGGGGFANFVPYSVTKPIWRFHGKKNKEIYKELNEQNKISIAENELIQNEFGLGSQQNKNQNMIDGETQIKKICWKLEVDRLGNISKA